MDPFQEQGTVSAIHLYPIKSLEGISLQKAEVLPSGALKFDRQYTFWSQQHDNWVRAKSSAELILINTEYDLEAGTVILSVNNLKDSFNLQDADGCQLISEWMSDYLHETVELREDASKGFFDDNGRARQGISVISTGTIDKTMQWFSGLKHEEIIRRMRMNITIDGLSPFWEEAIIRDDRSSRMQIGEIAFCDPWPCSRCSVPARDSHTAETDDGFAEALTANRQSDDQVNNRLHALSGREDFNGFFTLGSRLDGRESGSGIYINVGDPVSAV